MLFQPFSQARNLLGREPLDRFLYFRNGCHTDSLPLDLPTGNRSSLYLLRQNVRAQARRSDRCASGGQYGVGPQRIGFGSVVIAKMRYVQRISLRLVDKTMFVVDPS